MVGTTTILAVTHPQVNSVWVAVMMGIVFDMLDHCLVPDVHSFAQYQNSVVHLMCLCNAKGTKHSHDQPLTIQSHAAHIR